MSRLRIQLAKSDIDRRVAVAMGSAERLLVSALRDCEGYARTTVDLSEARRARSVVRDLRRVLGAITGVRRISPVHNSDDPDLDSTSKRIPIADPSAITLLHPPVTETSHDQ